MNLKVRVGRLAFHELIPVHRHVWVLFWVFGFCLEKVVLRDVFKPVESVVNFLKNVGDFTLKSGILFLKITEHLEFSGGASFRWTICSLVGLYQTPFVSLTPGPLHAYLLLRRHLGLKCLIWAIESYRKKE